MSKVMKTDHLSAESFSLQDDFLKNPLMSAVKLARYKFAARMVSEDDVVLDLGCGNGYSSYFLSKYARKVVGMDLYADIPGASKRMSADNLQFIKGDILFPPPEITEEEFTVVNSIDVIEHFHRDDGEKIVRDYSGLLSKNGMMIIGTPSRHSQAYRSARSRKVHFYEYEPEELRDMCRGYFGRAILFSMNDEIVHTGFNRLAWFIFLLCFK